MGLLFYLGILTQVTGITSGRAAALIPAALGMISVILGLMSLKRSRNKSHNGRLGVISAFALGSVGAILSISHLMRSSENEFGTGSGKLGAIVALILSLIGVTVSTITVKRSRKRGDQP